MNTFILILTIVVILIILYFLLKKNKIITTTTTTQSLITTTTIVPQVPAEVCVENNTSPPLIIGVNLAGVRIADIPSQHGTPIVLDPGYSWPMDEEYDENRGTTLLLGTKTVKVNVTGSQPGMDASIHVIGSDLVESPCQNYGGDADYTFENVVINNTNRLYVYVESHPCPQLTTTLIPATTLNPEFQKLDFKSGWNLFSVNVYPNEVDMKNLFQPLIDDGSLIKIQDEIGNALEDYGVLGGWINNIGDIKLGEGYKIEVSKDCQLDITGDPVYLPFEIPLKIGWNIIGYPKTYEVSALAVVNQLIDRDTLVKVQDENGNSLEYNSVTKRWVNNIGNFKPGKGYKIKLNTDDILEIFDLYEPTTTLLPTTTFYKCTQVDLGFHETVPSLACSTTMNLYDVNNDDFLTATEIYFRDSSCHAFALTGWYSDGTYCRYWNGSLSEPFDCNLPIPITVSWSASPMGMGGTFFIKVNDMSPIVQVFEESSGSITVNTGDKVTVYMDGGGCTGVGVNIDGYCSDSDSGPTPGHFATCSAIILGNTFIHGGSCPEPVTTSGPGPCYPLSLLFDPDSSLAACQDSNPAGYHGNGTSLLTSSELYYDGECKVFAGSGYYSDGIYYRYWDGNGNILSPVACGY